MAFSFDGLQVAEERFLRREVGKLRVDGGISMQYMGVEPKIGGFYPQNGW